jgi:fatty-acyl-CoA synthase
MQPTGFNRSLPLKNDGFASLVDALEYAARGETGCNFYDGRGELNHVLSYRDLRDQARTLAGKLSGLGCPRGSRLAIIGETDPLFHRFFFACQYAGLVPVALPSGVQLGGRQAYVDQIRNMLQSCGAAIAVTPESHAGFLTDAAAPLGLTMVGLPADFDALPDRQIEFTPMAGDELAYVQYTSGSTRFPRGVSITQSSALSNLAEIATRGLKMTENDRLMCWLPFYHDMGLVGFVLSPLTSQLSVDYLSPRSFAMRPRLWLKIMSENRGTMSSSPPFGYALCAKRLRWSDCERYDLSNWRVACVGAERINAEPLEEFARLLKPNGFDPRAFVACYGMAECTLAISFAPLGAGVEIDVVDQQTMAATGVALPLPLERRGTVGSLTFVDCGEALPSYGVSIRDAQGNEVPERHCGHILLRGPSVMTGYFCNDEATREVMIGDGWMRTGDIGYRVGARIFITARHKDVIIINGRNIWPQDLEYLAEKVEGVKYGHVSAFAAPGPDGADVAVLVTETREINPTALTRLADEIRAVVQSGFGITAYVDLVPSGTLPRTSSGKLSRSQTRSAFIARQSWDATPGDRDVAIEANG